MWPRSPTGIAKKLPGGAFTRFVEKPAVCRFQYLMAVTVLGKCSGRLGQDDISSYMYSGIARYLPFKIQTVIIFSEYAIRVADGRRKDTSAYGR